MTQLNKPATVMQAKLPNRSSRVSVAQLPVATLKLIEHGQTLALAGCGRSDSCS
jgi:hypothetical protein